MQYIFRYRISQHYYFSQRKVGSLRRLMFLLIPILMLCLVFGAIGCETVEVTVTPEPTTSPLSKPTSTPTRTPPPTPSPSPTQTLTPTPTPTPRPTIATTLDKIVTFADPNLEAAVREAIAIPTGDIHQSNLKELTTLSANSEDIINLTGLEHCINLVELSLSSNQISDLFPLAGLTSLAELDLGDNRITNIAPLSNLNSLTYLDLSTNEIDNVSALSSLTKLINLDLSDNLLNDVTPLFGLESLTKLRLAWNPISLISPIANLTKLADPNPSATCSTKSPGYFIGKRVSVEPGKNAYIWPDDAKTPGVTSLWDLTKWHMQDGDTLYLREGTFEGPILTIDYTLFNSLYKRIHIRGSGSDSTILQGYIMAGGNSTIENLTVDSRGIDRTSISIDGAGALIENVVVTGGRIGISVRSTSILSMPTETSQVILRCVTVSDVTLSGVLLGGREPYLETHGSVLENVEVVRTGGGVYIYGDRVAVHNLIIRDIGSTGLYVKGSDTTISSCLFSNINNTGVVIDGNSAQITNTYFRHIGMAALSINGNNAEVRDSWFGYIGSGILVDGNSPNIRNVDIYHSEHVGLRINGNYAKVRDSWFSYLDGRYGISVDGYAPELINLIIKNVGSSEVGSGLILGENSNNYVVSHTLFRTIRVGIRLEGVEASDGELSNNLFKNIFYQEVLEVSSYTFHSFEEN